MAVWILAMLAPCGSGLAEEAPSDPSVQMLGAARGSEVTGQITADELKQMLGVSSLDRVDIATVRYIYTNDAGQKTYGIADISGNVSEGISYSFEAPADGFETVEGAAFTNQDPGEDVTVAASCFRTDIWDGAVDVSWYDETSEVFHISSAAQLAGLAAVVDGNVDAACDGYEIKGERITQVTDALAVQAGLYNDPDTAGTAPWYYRDPDSGLDYKHFMKALASTYKEDAIIPADQIAPAHISIKEHYFGNRKIILDADLDLGGADGSQIDHSRNYNEKAKDQTTEYYGNNYDYPNWMPIGGSHLSDLDDPATLSVAYFNGTFEGNGHYVDNMYCYRWSYPGKGRVAYAYSEATALFGAVGGYYRSVGDPLEIPPTIRNMSVSGYSFGRRSAAGLVGTFGRGTNADWTNPIEDSVVENCVSHVYAYSTDSKGVGGIVGYVWSGGRIVNCYNTGNLKSQEYKTAVGGICGENRGADIYSCYNVGEISSSGEGRGYGIGSNATGESYTVSDCYYLDGSKYYECPDVEYQGYYYKNAPNSISVSATPMSMEQMTDGTLLNALNAHGQAFTAGDDGLPRLTWEKEGITAGSFAVDQPENGTVSEVWPRTDYPNGTVVYLQNSADTGWNFRYYTLNGRKITEDYVTVHGDTVVSAVYEASKPGVLDIVEQDDCTVSVVKDGMIMEDGVSKPVTGYPVKSGDELYEQDRLTVTVQLKDGVVPEDPDYVYQGAYPAEFPQPFRYNWTYSGDDPLSTSANVIEVTDAISRDSVRLTLNVDLLITRKTWLQVADTSWYDAGAQTYTLTTPRQLAGLDKLVTDGNSFSGKTVRLGGNIDFTNDDGTGGRRWWNGIGSGNKAYSGTFDGNGKKITNLLTSEKGFFDYCSKADVKNVTLYGSGEGAGASGLCAKAGESSFTNCANYRTIDSDNTGGAYIGGIIGEETGGCSLTNCQNYGSVAYAGKVTAYVGGITGALKGGTLTGCVNTGDITKTESTIGYVGGIAGQSKGTISACANYGNVTGASGNTGGVIGFSMKGMILKDSYNTGSVTYDGGAYADDCAGGLIGYAQIFDVSNCYNTGVVSRKSGTMKTHLGGVFGIAGTKGTLPKSTDVTKNVYFSTESSLFAVDGSEIALLDRSLTYYQGLKVASPEEFAKAAGVLAGINENKVFALTNGKYPELSGYTWHRHTGGKATCAHRAVCTGCGLAYGDLDPDNHEGEGVDSGRREPEWMTDGTTGDLICEACGAVLQPGTVLPANRDEKILTVSYAIDGEVFGEDEYTVAEFDDLAETTPLSWQYAKGLFTRYYVTRYVSLDTLLAVRGYSMTDGFTNIQITASGANPTITREFLMDNNRYYYDLDGGRYTTVKAGLAIYYATGYLDNDNLDQLQKASGLMFGCGISEQVYRNRTLEGNKFYKPVTAVTINVTRKNHRIKFDSAGGSKTDARYAEDGGTVAAPRTPYREHYSFTGWYLGDEEYDFTKPVTEDLTLQAHWEQNMYTVTFDPNGGKTAETARTVGGGEAVGELPVPTRSGYTFTGWFIGDEKYTETSIVGGDLELKAGWKVNKKKNPMTVKGKTAKVRYSRLKKRNQTLKRSTVLSIKKAKGTVTCKRKKGNRKIVVAKSGKVTVKRGLKKGTYKVRVSVKAAGNSSYKPSADIIVTFKIKVM